MTKIEAVKYILDKVKDDEPVFILRAGDIISVATILKWVRLASDYNVNRSKIDSALVVVSEFLRYQGGKKIPD